MQITCQFYEFLHQDAMQIRQAVFMQEQGFQNEFDQIDEISTHVVLYDEQNQPIATGRLFPDSNQPKCYIIGRVAVRKAYRHQALGSKLLACLEEKAIEKHAKQISLSAQCRVQKFYESLGYIATDDIHDDEGCPHVTMIKKLHTC